jgi:hypothetical protein
MNRAIESIGNRTRRALLQRALGVTAVAAVAAPAYGKSVHPQKMRLRLEGDTTADWVLSLYLPPILTLPLPPGTAARLRAQYPAPATAGNPGHGHYVMAATAFLAPAGVPPGVPAPELAPISVFEVDVEEVVVADAAFGEASTRPSRNVAVLGRIVSNAIESPFGSLLDRAATTTFGFDWTAAGSDGAVFKLVAINAAGSHLTVVPEAAGEIAFG